jgi:hypothetical protein
MKREFEDQRQSLADVRGELTGASSVGISTPSVFAVFRLIKNRVALNQQ